MMFFVSDFPNKMESLETMSLWLLLALSCCCCNISQCRSLPATNTVSLPPGVQIILPNYPFSSSGLLKEVNVRVNQKLQFHLQLWRPEKEEKTFSNVWSVAYNPGVQEAFHHIDNETLQWRSQAGVPVRSGYVFGVYVFKTSDSMPLTQHSKTGSLPQSKVYYIQSAVPPCSVTLCDKYTLDSIDPSFIKVTLFEKTGYNLTSLLEKHSSRNTLCHKVNNFAGIQRTKRNGDSDLSTTPSPSPTTATPTHSLTPTLTPSHTNTPAPTDDREPPGFIIKISPEAIAFIIVGVLLLVVLVVLVFVLVACLRTKGVKVEQKSSLVSSTSSAMPPDIEAGDSRMNSAEQGTSHQHEEAAKRRPPPRSGSHHYINGEITHRGVFSAFFPLYVNTSPSPLTQSIASASHEQLRNERVNSTSVLQNNHASPRHVKPPYRARSVGPSARLCTGIQAPPVPPRGQSRSRGAASSEPHRYSVLEASTDPPSIEERRRAKSFGGWVGARVHRRDHTPHDYAEPDSPSETKENELVQSFTYDRLADSSPAGETSGSLVPGPRERGGVAPSEEHSYSDPDRLSTSLELSSEYNYDYVPTEDQRRMVNSDHYEMQDSFQRDSATVYDRLRFFEERETYWAPASTESGLYTQLYENKYRELPRSEIKIVKQIGSGHFGAVSMGVWLFGVEDQQVEVAVKAVKGSSELERIKLLQEAAIMGQFAHCNVVRLLGVVTLGDPALVILEYMTKGDLRSFLQKLHPKVSKRELPEILPELFIKFSKDIANGMSYLSNKSFVHRDLAARNILLSNNLTCKIGDFGMARDVENDYYKSHGGIIPVKWTAPEALNYNKFSTASDVWSYGMVLFEIWSLGEKPFNELTNPIVIALVSSKHCQAPPPGCPRAIYHLMVECWHPEPGKRPTFDSVYTYLESPLESLTHWHPADRLPDKRAHLLGAPLREANNLYLQLQRTYQKPLIGNSP